MVFPVQPSDEEAKHQMAVDGFTSIKENEAAAIENKDYDNHFLRRQAYCSADSQPRILQLLTQAYA
jgi:hypothetical protein